MKYKPTIFSGKFLHYRDVCLELWPPNFFFSIDILQIDGLVFDVQLQLFH